MELFGMTMAILGLGVAYFAIWLGINKEKAKREFEHLERMKALELGRPLPGDLPWLSPMKLGLIIAVAVPTVTFVFAFLSTSVSGYHENIWQSAGMVGIFAVTSGAVIAALGVSKQGRGDGPALASRKFEVEEDAYDVVSTRG